MPLLAGRDTAAVLPGYWMPGELHLLAVELTEALTNVHRIAVSRGGCLLAPSYVGVDEQDAPEAVP
ncbi:hypothetical protein [Streptomyces sp. NPDC127084]|uniref:hypothetical protein n=1 Tax=Streptomyces sp. NPDC127084 TaxID=3347133 RepID=UPI003658F97E